MREKNTGTVLLKNMNAEVLKNWKQQFGKKPYLESVWRRTQESYNTNKSGWKSEEDFRRRMVQFKYDFAVIKQEGSNNLICKKMFIWLHLSLPKVELEKYLKRNIDILKKNRYTENDADIFTKKEYTVSFKKNIPSKLDLENGTQEKFTKKGYETLEMLISNYEVRETALGKPWETLEVGYRKILKSGTPEIKPLSVDLIEQYLPAEVEIGSGASYEIGVPPLHNLHHYFYVSDEGKNFYLGGDNDNLLKDFSDNEDIFLKKTCKVVTKSIKVKEGVFLKNLYKMYKQKKFIGKINVNSFDGLHLRSGLIKEKFLREWSKDKLRPIFERQKKSKALFVVGLHADRRQTQQYAREQGLQIIHIDSEGFEKDTFIKNYAKESLQDGDILIRAKASEFGKVLAKILKK